MFLGASGLMIRGSAEVKWSIQQGEADQDISIYFEKYHHKEYSRLVTVIHRFVEVLVYRTQPEIF